MEDRDGDLHVVSRYTEKEGAPLEPLEKTKFSPSEIRKFNPPEIVPEEKRKEIRFGKQMISAIEIKRREYRRPGGEWLIDRAPFVNAAYDGKFAMDAIFAAETLKEKWEKTGEFDHSAAQKIALFMVREEAKGEEYERKGWVAKAWDLVTRLPGFMIEFGTTFGAAQAIKAGGKKLLFKTAVEGTEHLAKKGLVRKVGGKALDLTTTAMIQAPLDVPRMFEKTTGYMAPSLDENAQLVDGDDLPRALTRAFTTQTIENLTERMGGAAVGKGLKVAGRPFMAGGRMASAGLRRVVGDKVVDGAKQAVAKWTGAQKIMGLKRVAAAYMAKTFPKITPGKWLAKMEERGQFHGGLGEYLEERYGELMRGAVDYLTDLDISNPDGVLNNLANAAGDKLAGKDAEAKRKLLRALEHTLVEAVAFTAPGLSGRLAGGINKRYQDRKAKKELAAQAAELSAQVPAGQAPDGGPVANRAAPAGPHAPFIPSAEWQDVPPGMVEPLPGTDHDQAGESTKPPFPISAEGGYATLANGSRVAFGQGAMSENGDLVVPGQDGKPARTIPASSVVRVESTDGRTVWKRPPQENASGTPVASESIPAAPPNRAVAEGGVATLSNGSRVAFGKGAISENGDLVVPGKAGKPVRTIPASSVVRVESNDGRTVWKRPSPPVSNGKPADGKPPAAANVARKAQSPAPSKMGGSGTVKVFRVEGTPNTRVTAKRAASGAGNAPSSVPFSTLGRVGPEFDPKTLDKILANLKERGVVIAQNDDVVRFLERQGAGAMYIAENGKPGALLLRPSATRIEVVEELVHHGQHVNGKYVLPTDSAALSRVQVQREVQAQDIVLGVARRMGWTAEEIAKIEANKAIWLKRLAELAE